MRMIRLSLLSCLLLASTRLSSGAVLSVQPVSASVSTGQTFSVTIGVTSVSDLYAYQLDVDFNPAILSAVSVSEGSFLSSAGSTIFLPGTIDDTAGTVSFNADTLESAVSGVSGAGTLLTFSFQALTAGNSTVQIENSLLLNSFGEGIVLSTVPSVVTVNTAAPEPATWLLFGLCTTGLVTLRRLWSW